MQLADWLGSIVVGIGAALFTWLMIWVAGWAGLVLALLLAFVTITGLCAMNILTNGRRGQ